MKLQVGRGWPSIAFKLGEMASLILPKVIYFKVNQENIEIETETSFSKGGNHLQFNET